MERRPLPIGTKVMFNKDVAQCATKQNPLYGLVIPLSDYTFAITGIKGRSDVYGREFFCYELGYGRLIKDFVHEEYIVEYIPEPEEKKITDCDSDDIEGLKATIKDQEVEIKHYEMVVNLHEIELSEKDAKIAELEGIIEQINMLVNGVLKLKK